MAARQRNAALAKYYANPNLCERCLQPIQVLPDQKLHAVRVKRFCSRSCAASKNNKTRKARVKKYHPCVSCSALAATRKGKRCITCQSVWNEQRKAEQLVNKTKSETSYRQICLHARYSVRNREQKCQKCGYSYHVECCHLQAVSTFPPTAKIAEINAPTNLRLLCPNCHWEHDHPNKTMVQG